MSQSDAVIAASGSQPTPIVATLPLPVAVAVTPRTTQTDSTFVKFLIGGTSCAITSTIVHPVDTIKIRLQMQRSGKLGVGAEHYRGFLHCGVRIFKTEGLRGFARGLESSVIRELTYSSIRIGAYEPIREGILHALSGDKAPAAASSQSVIAKFLASLISGAVGSAIANPTDLVKTRFQAATPSSPVPYRNTFHAFAVIARTEGIGYNGLYRGVGPTVVRAAVLTSSQLGSYDAIKNDLLVPVLGMKEGFSLHVCASLLAGFVTTTATTPVDLIKTRIMGDREGKYRGPLDCVRKVFAEEGPRAFLKAWQANYLRLAPHTIISFFLMEQMRSLLGMRAI